jgi:hypothetical protein
MSYTHETRIDGFGAQYQTIITTILYCYSKNIIYLYSPLQYVEHNYENDPNYIDKLEHFMNLKDNIQNRQDNTIELNFGKVNVVFEQNMDDYCNSEAMQFIKDCFWKNKERNHFKNNKINIALHIRRENHVDNGLCGERGSTSNSYYLKIMNEIREANNEKQLQFHIYSQGGESNFNDLKEIDVEFHLNEEITSTFIGLVAAEILIISPSSFSYSAALLRDGVVIYKNFWHPKKKEWILRG